MATGHGDLIGGMYPLGNAFQGFLGSAGQAGQPNLSVRSNIEFPMFSGPLADTAGASVAASGVMFAVPVPVDVGMEITNLSVLVGATAAGTPTHQFAALYSGTTVTSPPLIAQTVDATTTAMAASKRYDFAFASGAQQIITAAQAPYGFVYLAYSLTATTLASLITIPCGAAAGQYRWFTNTPLYFSQTSGTAVGGTAPATLVNASTLTVAPVVFAW